LTYLTASLGLMVRGKRLPSYFASDDTTKEPGFNPLYHNYLSIGASYDFALANGMIAKPTNYCQKYRDWKLILPTIMLTERKMISPRWRQRTTRNITIIYINKYGDKLVKKNQKLNQFYPKSQEYSQFRSKG